MTAHAPVERPARLTARHRAAAIAALALTPAGAVLVVAAVVLGLPGLVLSLVGVVVAGYAAFKALVRRGIRRRVYAALAVAVFVASIAGVVVVGIEVMPVVVGAALLGVGSLLAGAALSVLHKPSGRLVGRAHHPVLLVNPRSGDGDAEEVDLVAEAQRRGIRVVELGEGDDLVALARREARRGADCLGMAGGDGSLACVAEVAMGAHVPFVCIPAGTKNHFALDLGLDRSDPVGALDAFGEGFQRRIDVGTVNGRVFLNNVSVGAYGEVVADEQYRERKIGTTLERIPDLVGPDSEPLELRFVDGDGVDHDRAVALHVSNNTYELTPAPGFGSRPSLVDGQLGVVAVLSEGNGDAPRVASWQAPRFAVGSSSPVLAGVDGEAEELEVPVRFEIRPGALRVRIPRHVAGVSPAARRPPITVETARRLVSVARGVRPDR